VAEEITESNGSKAWFHEARAVTGNHNFHDYASKEVASHLVIEGEWQNEFLPLLSRKPTGLSLMGRGAVDFSWVPKHLPDLEVLLTTGSTLRSVNALSELRTLEELSLGEFDNGSHVFDLPASLKSFSCTWRKRYRLGKAPPGLENLSLDKAKDIDLADMFGELENLVKADLVDCRFVDGCDEILRSPRLRYLSLDACGDTGFKEDGPTHTSLKYANLTRVRFDDLSWLRRTPSVDILILASCGDIQSLAPLRHVPALRGLWISGNTRIVDGDLSILESLPLENLVLIPRKHYSHTSLAKWSWSRFGTKPAERLFARK
jgi:hypothetical protein